MAWVLGHRQTKGAATDIPSLPPPRHTSTLPQAGNNKYDDDVAGGSADEGNAPNLHHDVTRAALHPLACRFVFP